MTQKVITYQDRDGRKISLTQDQVKMLDAAGKWPKSRVGSEYCQVSQGLHWGEPSMTDEELSSDVGI